MKSFGLPDKIILGEVLESDPPRKLVQTWHPQFTPEMTAEPPSRLTYEIMEGQGVCTVTITHDVTGAPMVAGMVPGGGDPAKGGGGSEFLALCDTGYMACSLKKVPVMKGSGADDLNEVAARLAAAAGKPFTLGKYEYDV